MILNFYLDKIKEYVYILNHSHGPTSPQCVTMYVLRDHRKDLLKV